MAEENNVGPVEGAEVTGGPTPLEPGMPIDLFDESGESVRFDHLDSIELEGTKYVVLTPHLPEGEDIDDDAESDVYIMKLVDNEKGENVLEIVEDEPELEKVFNEFKKRMAEEFDFVE